MVRYEAGAWRGVWQLPSAKRPLERWIHLNQDVDSGSQWEDIENVDVVVFPFGPPVSKVQKLEGKECTVGWEITCSRKVT